MDKVIWNRIRSKKTGLPEFEKDVLVTVREAPGIFRVSADKLMPPDKLGYHTEPYWYNHKDYSGEGWNWIVAWAEAPEPYFELLGEAD